MTNYDELAQRRIRLAEAMGFQRVPDQDGAVIDLWTQPGNANNYFRAPGVGLISEQIPDPFTDANNAWAVYQQFDAGDLQDEFHKALQEVVARRCHPDAKRYCHQVSRVEPWDWPRAALEVLDNDLEGK